jgi:glucose-6-phosphate-specific signal transduction histidine kinase
MGLVGSLPETRAEIAQNLWDEIGQEVMKSRTSICIRIY